MKKADTKKKLNLNKRTVSRLDLDSLRLVRGGMVWTVEAVTCSPETGETDCSECGGAPPASVHVKTKQHVLCPPVEPDITA